MAKILFVNPNKWGRGITHIWIASHAGILKRNGHEVSLFDASFYLNWSEDETSFNTENKQYRPSDYHKSVTYKKEDIFEELQLKINTFKPDFIFFSAISSHIHGEGEYVNIQNGYNLLCKLDLKGSKLITGGLQATASPKIIMGEMEGIDILIRGESEFVLLELLDKFDMQEDMLKVRGIAYVKNEELILNEKQEIINNLDLLAPYDYSMFEDQCFLRPYNGEVIRAVDFEISRGCIYSCAYCVETVIQDYYGFREINKSGAIKNFKSYLRNKSENVIFEEIKFLSENYSIKLFRFQDTNFLTIDRSTLVALADLIDDSSLDIILYIETRPEGINHSSVELLKKLKVDGVGMGVELSSQDFRESELNRFADHKKIIDAFKMLKENNIRSTAYNVIGFPNQDEDSILNTIEFNKVLKPDNITVAYYSPYYGTQQQKKSFDIGLFNDYEQDVDGQLRSVNRKNNTLSKEKLDYYKKNFYELVENR